MARQARKKCGTGIYHVMLRGNEGKPIFIDEEDKDKIIEIIQQKKDAAKVGIYAFCVMDNHIHVIVRERETGSSLENMMKRIGVSYAMYFNKKYKRIGHVFQDRFRSEAVEDDSYLISVIRYVHNNPVKAGFKTGRKYQWNSYLSYIGKRWPLQPEMEEVLDRFSIDRDIAVRLFISFMDEEDTNIYLEISINNNEELAQELLRKCLIKNSWEKEDLKRRENRIQVSELIKEMGKQGLSGRQIAELIGLNRELVRRIIVSKEPSP
jgi:putative transposase